jgi:quercetin dioxygenase-like cupin family protein
MQALIQIKVLVLQKKDADQLNRFSVYLILLKSTAAEWVYRLRMSSLLSKDAATKVNLSSSVEYAEGGIVSKNLLQTEALRVTLFAMDEGQELTEHSSDRRALVQVLEGTCAFFYNDAWDELKPGEILHMPPRHLHSVRATTRMKFLLILQRETKAGE